MVVVVKVMEGERGIVGWAVVVGWVVVRARAGVGGICY
jgi:hypothetical protein